MSVASNQDVVETTPLIAEVMRRNSSFVNVDPRDISPVVEERRGSVTVRRPLQYHSINSSSDQDVPDEQTRASLNRYKYYNKLSAPAENRETALLMPHHVVPANFFDVVPAKEPGAKQNSIITIFSIWNTMMGTSVLSMPWALEQAGFAWGIILMIVMAGFCLYTAYRVMNSVKVSGSLSDQDGVDFPDVCRYWMGRWGEGVSIAFSVFTLMGAAVVYWVLMSNFLYHVVTFIYEEATHGMSSANSSIVIDNTTVLDAYCPDPPWRDNVTVTAIPVSTTPLPSNTSYRDVLWYDSAGSDDSDVFQFFTELYQTSRDATFKKVWKQDLTVPFFLVVVFIPVINLKSPTFFTKLNALGTVSVIYILICIATKAYKWGLHVDFSDASSPEYIQQFQWTFPALTGTLSLALFIHNCVISIMRTQKNPENNGRDLSIAYGLVIFTYVFIGVAFYITFPLPKGCIADNLLNNFRNTDIMAFVARLFLFVQMFTVFPLLLYILRAQFLSFLFGNVYPSLKHVVFVNCAVLGVCVLFAIFLPQIGQIIRFSGAVCGLAYIFALPCIVHMLILKRNGKLTWLMLTIHVALIGLGVANFVSQIVITVV